MVKTWQWKFGRDLETSPAVSNINLHLNGFMHPYNAFSQCCVYLGSIMPVSQFILMSFEGEILWYVVLHQEKSHSNYYLTYCSYLRKAVCHILGGKLHTQDGFLKNILLPCFVWQGFIFSDWNSKSYSSSVLFV